MASSSSVPALLHMRNVVDGQRRIYLVENNVNFAEYLTCIFKLAGYYIDLVAKEHVTSLKWIDQVSLAPPDLVVLNIGMFSEPERFLLQIRARIMSEEMTWFPPILLFTTYQSQTDLKKLGYSVLLIPASVNVLLTTVEMVIDQR